MVFFMVKLEHLLNHPCSLNNLPSFDVLSLQCFVYKKFFGFVFFNVLSFDVLSPVSICSYSIVVRQKRSPIGSIYK